MESTFSELHSELKRQLQSFLEEDHEHGHYASRISDMINSEEPKYRLMVDVADLRSYDVNLHTRLMNEPAECLPAFEDALEETVQARDPKWLPEGQKMRIGLEGEFGAHTVSPRNLLAPLISKMVNVQGIVTKCSLVRPKMVKSVHYCEATQTSMTREYRDVTSHHGPPTGSAYPTKDDNGNLLTTEFGLCQYRDNQVITVQELPETSPPGQLPRSVDLILEDDLVDSVKPGDRVEVAGVYKAVAPNAKGSISGVFRAIVCGVAVKKLTKELALANLSKQDVREIKDLSKKKDILELLGKSLAPSIYGHKVPKEALILLLLGGMEKNLANGTHLRGDINCLFVGDPGVAKSQMLRAVMNVSPLAVNTTGRGSSGVGLTAAVTVDKDTGEKRLEAGAMVLADRGVVCIDEFDKMSDIDRVSIHEVMEQQTVTIAKAGIHTTLNARCSVVAAANPLYGSYEASLDKAKNINLPDSLLSRFDLIFVMLDSIDHDEAIATHVLGQHRYRAPGDDHGIIMEQDVHSLLGLSLEDEEDNHTSNNRVKYNALLHGERKQGRGRRNRQQAELPLNHTFLKKYIHYAKARIKPELTADASDNIAAYYTTLRQYQSCPKVTVRMLETIIRLSTAHAKLRLSQKVEPVDVEAVKEILDLMTGYNGDGRLSKGVEDAKESIEKSREIREELARKKALRREKRLARKAAAAAAMTGAKRTTTESPEDDPQRREEVDKDVEDTDEDEEMSDASDDDSSSSDDDEDSDAGEDEDEDEDGDGDGAADGDNIDRHEDSQQGGDETEEAMAGALQDLGTGSGNNGSRAEGSVAEVAEFAVAVTKALTSDPEFKNETSVAVNDLLAHLQTRHGLPDLTRGQLVPAIQAAERDDYFMFDQEEDSIYIT